MNTEGTLGNRVQVTFFLLASAAQFAGQRPDTSQIAVIVADGSMLQPANTFPFGGRTLLFTPAGAGYRVESGPIDHEEERGEKSAAWLDNPAEVPLPFLFPFFGRTYRRIWVYEYGVIAFEQATTPHPEEDPASLAEQPPLIAPLWHPAMSHPPGARLPEGLYVNTAAPDRVVLTWFREMAAQVETILNTYQVTLFRDGRIRIVYTDIQQPEGLVGLSSGRQPPTAVRLADGPALRGTSYELFHLAAYHPTKVARAFYREHPDSFDALALFETFPLSHGSVTAHVSVKNAVRGIGRPLYDQSAAYGSRGRLASILEMNRLDFLDSTDDASPILAHEFAHRWIAYISFMDGGRRSGDLVEPGGHWCFYLDTRVPGKSDADGRALHSFLGGTLWEEHSPGQFVDGIATQGAYTPLELYLMGLSPSDSVPDFFYVGDRPATAACGAGGDAVITGGKRTVTIRQVIAAEGPREPDAAHSPKAFRVAFVLLVPPDKPRAAAAVARLDRVRRKFERAFATYSNGLGTVDTHLSWSSQGP